MGAGTHFIGQGKGNPDSLTDILRQAGATTIRDEISWGQVETQPSVLSVPPAQDEYVRSAVASGLDVLIILDYGNRFYDQGERPTSEAAMAAFTRYATFMAKHFRGVVNKFEIWNEWDIPIGGVTGPGDPADYMRLVRTVSVALKEVDPNITVVAGAMTNAAMYNGFLDGTLAGGLLQHCDVVSAHPYNWGEELQARRPEAWLTRMDWLQSKLRDHNGGRDFPVYVTEMGWPTQIDERGIATNRAGAHCARMYLLAATLPYLKGLWWYDLQDDGWGATEPEDNFGLIRADETPKPSYYSYAAAAAFLRGARFRRRIPTPDADAWALFFSSQGSHDAIALWSAHLDDDWSVVLRDTHGKGNGKLTVEELGRPAIPRRWGRREWYSDQDAPILHDEMEVTLRRNPIIVRGSLDGVEVTRVTKRPFPESSRSEGLYWE
ncbi:cellulase family glycosylhydrolase [Actinopolymorpha pittospori]|uniref:Glycoside hydrolase family 5 domain-containing protein n=2 Tax=Actinopolymorpha pittospori TaxID=648752 RepID=A0A927MWC6_9ACTN|nr:cellulase family glycosylhydrolase [Actinopolymorpha pittospori]MBE1608121.1 hypothetical protein [Actinopolymorpha pittospori]